MVVLILSIVLVAALGVWVVATAVLPAKRSGRRASTIWTRHRARVARRAAERPVRSAAERAGTPGLFRRALVVLRRRREERHAAAAQVDAVAAQGRAADAAARTVAAQPREGASAAR